MGMMSNEKLSLRFCRTFLNESSTIDFYVKLIRSTRRSDSDRIINDLNDTIDLLESLGFEGKITKYNMWYDCGAKGRKNDIPEFKYNRNLIISIKNRLPCDKGKLLIKMDPTTTEKDEQVKNSVTCLNAMLRKYNVPFAGDGDRKRKRANRTLHGVRMKCIRVAESSFRRFCNSIVEGREPSEADCNWVEKYS